MVKNDRGFTLIEIMAVLIIMGVLSGAIIWKFDVFNKGSTDKLALIALADLNDRERMEWTNVKLGNGWSNDDVFFSAAVAGGTYDLGKSKWQGLTSGGGTLTLNGNAVEFTRKSSESAKPGIWSFK